MLQLERRLSREKRVEMANLRRSHVGGVKRGERTVSLINTVKLADGLNISPAKLIKPIH